MEINQRTSERKNQKGALKQQQQEQNDLMERQKQKNEFKKIFQVSHSLRIQVLKLGMLNQSSAHIKVIFMNVNIINTDLANKESF